MSYFILRDGQQYGPYSQADVERYLRRGDIYPGDLSRTEKMNQWLPVSQVLGSAAPPPPSPDATESGSGCPPGAPGPRMEGEIPTGVAARGASLFGHRLPAAQRILFAFRRLVTMK